MDQPLLYSGHWFNSVQVISYSNSFTYTATPPQVTSHPIAQTDVLPGKEILFSVQATGTLPLSYQWQWKQFGQEHEQDEWQNLSSEGCTFQECETKLTLAEVDAHSAGHYRCVVSNCAGTTISQCASLTVGKKFCMGQFQLSLKTFSPRLH